jgi:hypothetical protein
VAKLLKWVSSEGIEVFLDGSTGVSVLRGASGLDCPPRALSIDERVTGAGGVLIRERTPTRTVGLPIKVDTGLANLSLLQQAFRTGFGTLIAGSGRELRNVYYESGLEGIWDASHGGIGDMIMRQFPLKLLALDPMWYGPMVTYDLTLGAQTLWSPNLIWSPHIPWSGGGSQTVEVEGDDDVWPVWSVLGPVTNLSAGLGTGRAWQVVPALTAGAGPTDVVTVDHRDGSKGPRYGSPTIPGFPEGLIDWSILTEVSRVDWPLPKGVNSVVLGGSDTTVDTLFTVAWEERWFSP